METKKIVGYSMYLIPGYGIYKEIKKPKKNVLAMVGTGLYFSLFLTKAFYVGSGILTNEWHPFEQVKNVFGTSKNENDLEKTVSYEEARKNNLTKKQ